jgi:hypothetical protein
VANGGYGIGNRSGGVAGGAMIQRQEITRHELKSNPVYELDDEAARKVGLSAGRT